MYVLRLVTLIVACVLFSACSRKSADQSTLTIKFDKTLIAQGLQAPPMAKVNATNTNGPNWGLNDPSRLAEIDCFGVFVGGPEATLQSSSCTNQRDEVVARFGPRAGFFPMNGKGQVVVPAGEKRRIYLVGMASADGTCDLGFDTNPDLRFSNYSNPFILGQTTKDLVKAEEVVEILLKEKFDSGNKINDCDFISPDGDDGTSPGASVTFFETEREHWIDTDQVPRTVQFSHQGESVECSRDGGSSFGPCHTSSPEDTFVWNVADYNSLHVIRVRHRDGEIEDFSFTPSHRFPGISFYNCDLNVTSMDTAFTAFSSRAATDNSTICFENGMSIQDASSTLTLGSNVQILSYHGSSLGAELKNTTESIFNWTHGNNFDSLVISGMRLEGISSIAPVLNMEVTNSTGTALAIVESSEVVNNNSSAALKATSAGRSFNVVINHSKITNLSSGPGVFLASNPTSYSVTTNIHQSEISSYGRAVYNNFSEASISESRLEGLGDSSYPTYTLGDATTEIKDSVLIDFSGKGNVVTHQAGGNDAYLILEGNIFIREANPGAGDFGAIDSLGASSQTSNHIISVGNNNEFCNIDGSIAFFNFQIGGSFNTVDTNAYSIQDNNGGNGNSIGNCPP